MTLHGHFNEAQGGGKLGVGFGLVAAAALRIQDFDTGLLFGAEDRDAAQTTLQTQFVVPGRLVAVDLGRCDAGDEARLEALLGIGLRRRGEQRQEGEE